MCWEHRAWHPGAPAAAGVCQPPGGGTTRPPPLHLPDRPPLLRPGNNNSPLLQQPICQLKAGPAPLTSSKSAVPCQGPVGPGDKDGWRWLFARESSWLQPRGVVRKGGARGFWWGGSSGRKRKDIRSKDPGGPPAGPHLSHPTECWEFPQLLMTNRPSLTRQACF